MDLGISSLIGSGLSAIGSVISTGLTNKANQNLNEQNISLQRETNAQQLELQREQWAREDSAVQRRALDLESAGLSKTLAAGSSANSTLATSLTAPKNTYSQNYSGLQNAFNLYSNYLANRYNESQIANVDAQTKKTQAETAEVLARSPYLEQIYGGQVGLYQSEIEQNKQSAFLFQAQSQYYQTTTPLQAQKLTAETNNILTAIDYTLSNIAVNDSRISLNNSQKWLNWANVNRVNKDSAYIAQQIVESQARTNYINKESQKIMFDTLNSFLQYQMNSFDFNISQKEGTKTKDTTSNTTFLRDTILSGVKTVLNTGGYIAGGLALGSAFRGSGSPGASYFSFGDHSDIRWRPR